MTTAAQYIASIAEAIRGFEEDEIILEALKDADTKIWEIAEEAAEEAGDDTAHAYAATLRARTEASPLRRQTTGWDF